MKFALMKASPEALQDIRSQYPDVPVRFYAAGADPANGIVLVWVESDKLPDDGYNGMVTLEVAESGAVTFHVEPGSRVDDKHAQVMAMMFARVYQRAMQSAPSGPTEAPGTKNKLIET